MRIARTPAIGLLAALLALAACEEGGMRIGSDDDAARTTRAEYTRQMIFVASDATAAALLEFTTVDAGSVVRRSARGWAEGGSGWTPLYDLTWEGPGLRRAWRLVPHGPIRLRVGLDDEIEAVTIRDENAEIASLESGDFISEWTPFHTSQLVLVEATLALGGEPITGWLVDASFGVTPQAAAPGDTTVVRAPNGPGPVEGAQPAMPAQDDTAGDSIARVPDTTIARPIDSIAGGTAVPNPTGPAATPVRALRAVLFTEDGATLVLGDTDTGLAGWLWSFDRELTLPTVTLTQVSGESDSWMIATAGDSPLSGRFEGVDEALVAFAPRMVRGTIEVDGDEFEVHGVLRPADAAE